MYGFMDINNDHDSRNVIERCTAIANFVKRTVCDPYFDKLYLTHLKESDYQTLREILEDGADWQNDIVKSELWFETLYTLDDCFPDHDVCIIAERIFGRPSNWPTFARKALANEVNKEKA
jgi:hypothetical protein